MVGCPGGEDYQLSSGPLPVKWVKRRKRKAAFAVAHAPMPVRRISCHNSFIGSVKGNSTTKQRPTISPTALNAVPAPGMPKQYSVGAVFPPGKAEIYAISQKKTSRWKRKHGLKPDRRASEREKAARLERHKSAAAQPAAKDHDTIAAALWLGVKKNRLRRCSR